MFRIIACGSPAVVYWGEADAGVIIHAPRFAYPKPGLYCLMDLGEWWEDEAAQLIRWAGSAFQIGLLPANGLSREGQLFVVYLKALFLR